LAREGHLDLAVVRARPNFQLLIMDLAVPTKTFAGPDEGRDTGMVSGACPG
jgi:hypothetical protein